MTDTRKEMHDAVTKARILHSTARVYLDQARDGLLEAQAGELRAYVVMDSALRRLDHYEHTQRGES